MELKDVLKIYNGYMTLVAAGEKKPITCNLCQAIMLHNVSHDDDKVFLQCLGCDHIRYPGLSEIRLMEEIVDGNHLG